MKMLSTSAFLTGAGVAIGVIIYNKFLAAYVAKVLPDKS